MGRDMTDNRDITERLECPSYDGAVFMRLDAAKEIRALRSRVEQLENDLAVAEIDVEAMRTYSGFQALDIITLGQEVGRLREALDKITALDVPRPVLTRYRADGKPSKYDRCAHLRAMWDACPDCISDYASARLAGEEK